MNSRLLGMAVPAIAGCTTLLLTATAVPAEAAWHLQTTTTGATAAITLPSGGTPSAVASGSKVTVSWPATLLPSGAPVTGYRIRRYDAGTGELQTVGAGCAGTVGGTSCAEFGVPDGNWRYSVQPVQGIHWRGIEGPRSATVVVFTLAASTAITFPAANQTYSANGFNAGCATGAGDICGTANAAGGWQLTSVVVSVRAAGGAFYDPATGGFTSAVERSLPATGTANWSVPFPASRFTANGGYTVKATSTDNRGQSVASTNTFTMLVNPPPAPTITGKPANPTKLRTATFTFTDSLSGVTFLCSLDGAAYSTCASGVSYANLSAGSHTFGVVARDVVGNSSTPASFTWTVDLTRPSAVDVQATNDGGGTAGKMESGDALRLTFSEPIDPASVKSGWNGSAVAVTVHVADGSSDRLTVTGTNLGTVTLGTGYAQTSFDVAATMVMSGNQIVVTLGQTSSAARTGSKTDMVWDPGALTDLADNDITSGSETESGTKDVNF